MSEVEHWSPPDEAYSDALDELDIDQLLKQEQENRDEQIAASAPPLPPLEDIHDAASASANKRKYIEDDDAIDEDELRALDQQLRAPDLSPTESIQPAAISCVECNALAHHVAFHKAFGVGVCNACQKQFPAKYKLTTKSTAKADYCLSDGELAPLSFMLKPNPSRGSWSTMKLYRLFDVLAVVRRKLTAITNNDTLTDTELLTMVAEEKQRRELEKLNRDISKRKKIRKEMIREEFIQSFTPSQIPKLSKVNKRSKSAGSEHVHEFVDDRNGSKRCKSCGFALEYEEL